MANSSGVPISSLNIASAGARNRPVSISLPPNCAPFRFGEGGAGTASKAGSGAAAPRPPVASSPDTAANWKPQREQKRAASDTCCWPHCGQNISRPSFRGMRYCLGFPYDYPTSEVRAQPPPAPDNSHARQARVGEEAQRRVGAPLVVRGARQRLGGEREERPHPARRHRYLFAEVSVGAQEFEGAQARRLGLFEVARHVLGRRQGLGQSPLEGVVPEVDGDAAEGLLDGGGRAQEVLAAGVDGEGARGGLALGLPVEPVGGERLHERQRAPVQACELFVEAADDAHHSNCSRAAASEPYPNLPRRHGDAELKNFKSQI